MDIFPSVIRPSSVFSVDCPSLKAPAPVSRSSLACPCSISCVTNSLLWLRAVSLRRDALWDFQDGHSTYLLLLTIVDAAVSPQQAWDGVQSSSY